MSLGNVLIFGDSYSTFKGWLPEGFGYSYSEEGRTETRLLTFVIPGGIRSLQKQALTLL